MRIEKIIAAAQEPLIDEIVELKKRAPIPGPVGEKGEPGVAGERGEKGEPGVAGERGEKGEPGVAGVDGERGEKGEPGERGEKGDVGERGEKGERGEAGAVGERGEKGEPGERGEKGDVGERGEKGDAGIAGERGEKGETGQTGIGYDVPPWIRKTVYREGVTVQHYIGQVFKALKDTVGEPGVSGDWERIGANGFRHTGVYEEGKQYLPGDLYIKDMTTYVVADSDGNHAKFIPAPRVDSMKGSAVIGEDGKGYIETKYGSRVELDFSPLLDLMTTVTADAITDQVKALAAERQQSFDKTKQMVRESEEQMITLTLAAVESQTKAWIDEALDNTEKDVDAPIKNYRGFYDREASYARGDVVTDSGGLYLALKATSAELYDEEAWRLMLKKPQLGQGGGGSGGLPVNVNSGVYAWVSNSGIQQWQRMPDGVGIAADAAARNLLGASVNGGLVIQTDDGSLWRRIDLPGGGGTQWVPVAPTPRSNDRIWRLEWDPSSPDIVRWRDDSASFTTVPSTNAMVLLPIMQLDTGKLVYNQADQKLYEFTASRTTLTRTIADWKEVGATGVVVVNRQSDLPLVGVKEGMLGLARFHSDGTTLLNRLFVARPDAAGVFQWYPVGENIFSKAQQANTDVGDPQENDIQITTESGHKEVKLWDRVAGVWVNIYSEDEVKGWIAAGNLFVGTAQEAGHGTAGAINLAAMPSEAALGATDKGHYWVWVGAAGHAIGAAEIGGNASSIDGQALQTGDWIQVAETAPGVFQYVVIPGDLLAKARADNLYGLNTWAAGAYEPGALIAHQGGLYKANVAVITTDPAPDDPTNTKWVRVPISAGVHNVPADGNLPATAPAGDVYLVINSVRAGGGPAFYIFDQPTNQWMPIGGSATGGTAMNLTGGEFIYNIGVPVGTVLMWPSDVLPAGFLYCDGAAFDATRYPALNQVLAGNRTPDLRGQFIRGASGTSLDHFSKHPFTTARPRRDFTTSSDGTHRHDFQLKRVGSTGSGKNDYNPGGDIDGPIEHTWDAGAHTHRISGGGDGETAPDHVILFYIIKADDVGMSTRVI